MVPQSASTHELLSLLVVRLPRGLCKNQVVAARVWSGRSAALGSPFAALQAIPSGIRGTSAVPTWHLAGELLTQTRLFERRTADGVRRPKARRALRRPTCDPCPTA